MDLVWSAMDKFKEAEILAKGENIEIVCQALVKIGIIYFKVN